jgi:hypothetical protein
MQGCPLGKLEINLSRYMLSIWEAWGGPKGRISGQMAQLAPIDAGFSPFGCTRTAYPDQ